MYETTYRQLVDIIRFLKQVQIYISDEKNNHGEKNVPIHSGRVYVTLKINIYISVVKCKIKPNEKFQCKPHRNLITALVKQVRITYYYNNKND